MLRDPVKVHAICEEYRAAASVDREHDDVDSAAGHRISCPLLALWSESGGLASWYADDGGPLAIWRRWANDVAGQPVPGGHFFPEEYPAETAARLRRFLSACSPSV
jgi:haloacetate dehalogenase